MIDCHGWLRKSSTFKLTNVFRLNDKAKKVDMMLKVYYVNRLVSKIVENARIENTPINNAPI